MDSGWAGVVGALIGGAASFGATWLHLSHERRAQKLANQERLKTVLFKGALCLPRNVETALGLLMECHGLKDKAADLDITLPERIESTTLLLIDPLSNMDSDLSSIPESYFPGFSALATASASIGSVRQYLSSKYLRDWMMPGGGAKRRIDGFVETLIEHHLEAMVALQHDPEIDVRQVWPSDIVKRLKDGLSVADLDNQKVTRLLEALREIARATSDGGR